MLLQQQARRTTASMSQVCSFLVCSLARSVYAAFRQEVEIRFSSQSAKCVGIPRSQCLSVVTWPRTCRVMLTVFSLRKAPKSKQTCLRLAACLLACSLSGSLSGWLACSLACLCICACSKRKDETAREHARSGRGRRRRETKREMQPGLKLLCCHGLDLKSSTLQWAIEYCLLSTLPIPRSPRHARPHRSVEPRNSPEALKALHGFQRSP